MLKINITKEQVGKVLVNGGKVVLSALAIGFASLIRDKASNAQYYIGEASYGDAVNVILGSTLYDSRKTEAISLLKRDGDAEYYRSVIATVNSNLYDSRKVETIQMLSKQ